MMKFSVLLSVYYREKPEYLKRAIESIYDDQILKPSEIILVEDGILTKELYKVIEEIKGEIGTNIFKSIKLDRNMGLGYALKVGVKNCKYELIARMDTDDIAYPERFEKQIKYMEKNQYIDVLGSYMSEFKEDIDNVICIKDAPNDDIDIKKYIKLRSPINHPTVVFKKSKVLKVGNYQEIFFNEDYYLWARMIADNCIFKNILEPLVYFRVSEDTYKRRGGLKYVKADFRMQKELKKLGLINKFEFLRNFIGKSFIRLIPNFLRKFIYLKFLRKNI